MTALTQDTPFVRNYAREVLQISRGKGVYLWDANGTRYLDFGSGIAVNAFGYGDRRLARIVARQMRQLVHVSNLYATPPGLELGYRLLEFAAAIGRHPFTGVHFGNSGAEANEAAIKYARLYAREKRGTGHHKILSFEHGFHGRTMGALSATPKRAYREKFEPLLPGFETVPFNDAAALEQKLDDTFAAVIVEVVQGEGGLTPLNHDVVRTLNELTARHDVLLIADEIQTGLGRLGEYFGSTTAGLTPDVITLSKPLAGGLPLSATLVPASVNDLVAPGDHGTTFGGGPVTSRAALHVLERLTGPGFIETVRERAVQLEEGLQEVMNRFDFVRELRGRGMLRGLRIDLGEKQAALFPQIISTARDHHLLILRSGADVIRVAPPLIISRQDMQRGLALLNDTLKDIDTRRRI
ncbi:MAG: acetylornithine transaminase [Spirochaeta sp.]|jgi:acetylornithine/N-succinyldiaminopimelate aminotransferase|nr:acetylornithine transaminase [Spirochaeta sp.]